MRTIAVSFIFLFLATPTWARGGRRWRILAANHSSQAIQNARANAYGLSRMRNVAMIEQFQQAGDLVPVPAETRCYYLHEVSADYRYLRPWAKLFLDRLSGDFYARFGERLRVTSLVRTVYSQRRLARFDPNAADATGPDRSAHLTGAALDISKHDMSFKAVEWMRAKLFRLKQEGYLYAIEEFKVPDFHIMVYPTYREYAARMEGQSQASGQARARSSRETDTSGK